MPLFEYMREYFWWQSGSQAAGYELDAEICQSFISPLDMPSGTSDVNAWAYFKRIRNIILVVKSIVD